MSPILKDILIMPRKKKIQEEDEEIVFLENETIEDYKDRINLLKKEISLKDSLLDSYHDLFYKLQNLNFIERLIFICRGTFKNSSKIAK